MDASYVKSDNIRFSSTYQNISSVEHLYFSISRNAELYRFPEKAKNFVRHLGLSTTISLYRNASLTVTAIMKKIFNRITAFLNDFYVWNTACKTAFYKIPSPFIVILSQKNALFCNILLLRVRYISILNSLCPFV